MGSEVAGISEEKLAEIREIFEHFDTNGDDRIERSEFQRLLVALGGPVEPSEAAAGLEILDADGSGFIEFGEFVNWWANRL
jgi:calmodulin